eukprot:COSAG02_NODE_24133_length_697_cov_0.777592_1_plen_106_part_01
MRVFGASDLWYNILKRQWGDRARYGELTVEVVPNVGVGSVAYAGAEICRGINFLFRDEGWGTPPLALESSVIIKPEDDLHGTQTVSWTSTVQFNDAEIIMFDAQVC